MEISERRKAFIEAARQYKDCPFRHQGRNPESGLDCVGVIVLAAQEVLGWTEGPRDYPNRPTSEIAFSRAAQFAMRISPGDARPGDVVQMRSGDHTTHFGILTDTGLIHATSTGGKVVEHIFKRDPVESLKRFGVKAWWRLNGMDDECS